MENENQDANIPDIGIIRHTISFPYR